MGLSKVRRHRLTALEVGQDSINEMSFKRHFPGGENESILKGMETAMGQALLGVRKTGLK